MDVDPLILHNLHEQVGTTHPDIQEMAEAGTAILLEIRGRGEAFIQNAVLEMDELVHTGMEEGSGAESEAEVSAHASRINNEGIEAQVAFIVSGNGATEGPELIREALGLGASPTPGR